MLRAPPEELAACLLVYFTSRPRRHLPLAGQTMKMKTMSLVLVLAVAVAAELVLAVKMKMTPILICTEIIGNFHRQITQKSNDHINGEENVELSGSAKAAAVLHT